MAYAVDAFMVRTGLEKRATPIQKASICLGLLALVLLFQMIRLEYELKSEWNPCGVDKNSPYCVEQHLFRSWEQTTAENVQAQQGFAAHEEAVQVQPDVGTDEPIAAAVLQWNAASSLLDESVASGGPTSKMSFVAGYDGSVLRVSIPADAFSMEAAKSQNTTRKLQVEAHSSEEPAWLHDFVALQERLDRMRADNVSESSAGTATTTSQPKDNVQPRTNYSANHAHYVAQIADVAAHQAAYKKRLEQIETSHKTWENKMMSMMTSWELDLCDDPARRNYTVCKHLWDKTTGAHSAGSDASLPEEQQAPDTAAASATFLTARQAEPKHTAWRMKPMWAAVRRGPPKENAEEFLSQTKESWAAMLPKVACVTLIPSSQTAMAYARHSIASFIDNFKAQSYEGQKQLVFVYHTSNHEAAALVKRHADGELVKGAAAFGPDLPSTAAYRFGAWSADGADVVARWDLNAWHHPRRLDTQVHAVALSARPGCLLQRWTVLQAGGSNRTEHDGVAWDSSLVGEAAWMHEYWHPLLPEEQTVLQGPEAHHVVHIDDSPDLIVYNAALMDGEEQTVMNKSADPEAAAADLLEHIAINADDAIEAHDDGDGSDPTTDSISATGAWLSRSAAM
eukprot:gnl/TRDRNA2_/TRDRNA2_184131_c0_seq1.p1 gnl/TRDRNA2_/TRDRNA2_184131_c0~~gnl/TRDRNA2_/TRDRNA2_184131_c0_seq1.p1  ORF type:complete len:655 (-),score=137.07 gnl/TRDRNA2_/TRDRNA2_184131_c0_seq1:159-2027(-)